MKHQTKLTKVQEQENTAGRETTLKFASPEEALRYDAAQTTVPPRIAQRLKESLSRAAGPARPWWRNLLPK